MSVDVETLIKDLTARRFWGVLELKFQAGRVTTVRKTETLVTTDFQYGKRPRPEFRGEHDEQHSSR